jgi:putative MATE family efflux protein
MGVTGSAIGTVIAQVLNALVLAAILRSGTIPNLKLPLELRPIDRGLAGELLKVGWPAAIDMLVLNAGFLTAIGLLGRIDQVTVAAHGLGMRVQALAFVPGLGIGQATSAMVGQALGAGNVERAKQVARASMVLCAVLMTSLAIVIIFAAHPLTRIFDVVPGSPLETYSVEWMRMLGYSMLPASMNIAMIGVLQGAGATRTSLRVNIWTTLAIQVPLSYILGITLDMGATGIWLSFPLAFVAKAALNYVAFKRGAWAVTGVRIAPVVAPPEH